MPVCKNTDRKRYTGKENTPLRRGYSASAEDEGKRMKGKDGNMYVASRIKGGKRWKLVKKVTSPRMFWFSKSARKLKAEILDLDDQYHTLEKEVGDEPTVEQQNKLFELKEKIHNLLTVLDHKTFGNDRREYFRLLDMLHSNKFHTLEEGNEI